MTFSFTGIAYLFGFFVIGLLAYRFFQYWRQEKASIAKGFFCFALSLSLFMLLTAVAGLFFAENTQFLKITVIIGAFFQGLGFAILAYLIVYIKFPKVSPWLGFFPVLFLGLTVVFLTATTPFHPHLEPSGGIKWDVQPAVNMFRFFIFLITFLPFIFIVIQQAKQQVKESGGSILKTRAFGIGLVLGFGIVIGLFDFILERILELGAVSSDIAMFALSIPVLIIILLKQKAPPKGKKQNYSYPSEGIKHERIKW